MRGNSRGCAVTAHNDAIRVETKAFVRQARVVTPLIKKGDVGTELCLI